MSLGRPVPRVAGDWLVVTMIYASPREAQLPGFDRWYWDLLAMLPRARRLLVVAGAYDSDNTIRELLEEARRRGAAVFLHFVDAGPLRRSLEPTLASFATMVEELESFAEQNRVPLDDPGEFSLDF